MWPLSTEVRHVVARCVASFCAAALGAHGTAGQWLALGAAVVLFLGTVVTALGLGRALVRVRAWTHRHAEAARLLGRHDDALGAVILDVPERVVYAVAGRPPAVVVSRATLRSLDENELGVVLAHERAHLAGRHHLVLGLIGALHRALPRLPLRAGCAAPALCWAGALSRAPRRGRPGGRVRVRRPAAGPLVRK